MRLLEPTERQKDILYKLAEGYTDPMIAESLGIGRATVHSHLEVMYSRLGVHTRAQAVAKALRQGWID